MTILLMDEKLALVKKGIRTNCKTLGKAFTSFSGNTNRLGLREPDYHFEESDPIGKKALSYLKGVKTKYSKLYGAPLKCFVSYSDDPTDWGGVFGL